MKSSSGKYYIALDHVRAIAIFTVFTWHFINVNYADNGYIKPVPFFPLSLLSQGHTGVAIFMTLSGYLFTKLLDGKRVDYVSFIWNRFLRLAPLLTLAIFIVGLQAYFRGDDISIYAKSIFDGIIHPSLPNGGWAITVEAHFYLLLPFLLFLLTRSKYALPIILSAAILLRFLLYRHFGEVQTLAYFTIIGRIDQFLLGIMAYRLRKYFTRKSILIAFITFLFAFLYWQFDLEGGFYHNPGYPSSNPLWIYMPTLEGIVYASIIAWYDNSFNHSTVRFSRFIATIGSYSYSIYLLHFFFVNFMALYINNYIDLSNIYLALLLSPIAFLPMIPIGYLGHRFIELPFLKFRTRYIVGEALSVEGK